MLRACPHHGFTELAQIDTFYNGLNDNDHDSLNVVAGGNLLSKTTREALQIIENKSKVRYSRNKPNVSRMNTTSRENASKTDDRIDKLADQILTLVDIFAKKLSLPLRLKRLRNLVLLMVELMLIIIVLIPIAINQVFVWQRNQTSILGTLPSNTISNPKGEMKAITTRSDVAYEGPSIPTPNNVVERETEETTDKEQTNFQGNALLLMPKFASMIKSLLTNKDKLFELAKIPLNENCSVMLLKKLPENLRDPGKFLIPCDFPGMNEYAQEILGFFNNSLGGNITSTSEPILSDSSLSLTSFKGSDFILEEIDAYLKDESVSPEIDHVNFKAKSSIKEPPELELKDLPSHLEYAYLEGADKLLVIIAKDLKVDEKEALLKVLKSHKREIAWKITDIKDGFFGYFQIPINPPDQEKTTFTCPYGTFAYRRMPFGLCNAPGTFQRMPFGLCNAPGTFQRCMMAIFHDMIEKTIEVFMDDFLVFGDSFSSCLSHLDTMLQRCEDTNLVLNWEKCHFMVKEGIVLGHKISKHGLEVDRSKVDVIAKLPYPTIVKGVRSFLGHAGFYQRFIQDFSKIANPMTHLLEKDTPFVFSKDCIDAFETLKKKLTKLRS
nr:reverse transcriptase domain-containing protein [Tanacetum cinerariifolium]